MAGDWIKLESVTPDKPEVMNIADILKIDPDAVLGKLIRLWIWADAHTSDGTVTPARRSRDDAVTPARRSRDGPSVTEMFVDRHVHCPGFTAAMVKVGWFVDQNGSLTFTNFDRHNAQTSKTRALTQKRNVTQRRRHRDAASVTKASPEKRREDKKKNTATAQHSSSAAAAANEKKPRERNEIWDALCAQFGLNPVTEKDRKWFGRIVADLRIKGATPEEIPIRAKRYREVWPNVSRTLNALENHWDELSAENWKRLVGQRESTAARQASDRPGGRRKQRHGEYEEPVKELPRL